MFSLMHSLLAFFIQQFNNMLSFPYHSVRNRWNRHHEVSEQLKQPRYQMRKRWYFFVVLLFAINVAIISLSGTQKITKITLTSVGVTLMFATSGFLSFFLMMPTISQFPSSYTLFQAAFQKAIPTVARIIVGILPVLMGYVISGKFMVNACLSSFYNYIIYFQLCSNVLLFHAGVVLYNSVPRMATIDLSLMNLFAVMKGDNVLDMFTDFGKSPDCDAPLR